LAAPAALQPLRSLEMRDVEHPAFERYGTAADHGREVLEQRSGAGSTASSRSATSATAAEPGARASLRSESAGTKRNDRMTGSFI
jgi:hypothetical protein